MSGDIKMDDPPAVVREHYEHIENLKSKRGHGKEVDRNHGLDMVVKKGPPRLRGRMAVTDHVLAHARLADVDIQLEQFPVNPWCAPERIVATHFPNQRSNLLWNSGTSRLSPSNSPGPEQAETLAMPTNHGRRLHNSDG